MIVTGTKIVGMDTDVDALTNKESEGLRLEQADGRRIFVSFKSLKQLLSMEENLKGGNGES